VLRGSGISITMYHLPPGQSMQDPHRWWRHEEDAMAIMTESVKTAYYWKVYGVKPWD